MSANSEGVTIQFDGSPLVLRYTLGAAKRINGQFGDFVKAYQRVSALDFTAHCIVVGAALGKEAHEVEEQVFRSGLAVNAADLSSYLSWLSNGGRDPALKPVGDGAETASGND